jgi:hypothetical protein
MIHTCVKYQGDPPSNKDHTSFLYLKMKDRKVKQVLSGGMGTSNRGEDKQRR